MRACAQGEIRMRGIRILALAAALGVLHSGATAQTEPLRLGFLTVKTGPLAAGGAQMEQGIVLFLKERNYTLAGRKVELFAGDTGGNPAQAKTRTQELIERNHVHVIIGPLATYAALAIDDYIRQAQVPLVKPPPPEYQELAQQKLNDYVIHAVGTAAQPMHVLGEFAAKQLGIKRVATVADDFTYGHEGTAGFQSAFEANGGRIVQKLWPPLNVPEYSVYVSQIKPDVDGVYAGFPGINGLRFLKQYAEFGFKRIPVFGNPTCVDEGVLRNMGDEALGELVLGGARHRREQALRAGGPRRVQGRSRVLHRRDLRLRHVPRVGAQRGQGPLRGQAGLRARSARRAPGAQPDGPDPHRRVRQAGPQHLRAQGRAQGWPPGELDRRHLPRGDAVLELRPAEVPCRAGVLARLPSRPQSRVGPPRTPRGAG